MRAPSGAVTARHTVRATTTSEPCVPGCTLAAVRREATRLASRRAEGLELGDRDVGADHAGPRAAPEAPRDGARARGAHDERSPDAPRVVRVAHALGSRRDDGNTPRPGRATERAPRVPEEDLFALEEAAPRALELGHERASARLAALASNRHVPPEGPLDPPLAATHEARGAVGPRELEGRFGRLLRPFEELARAPSPAPEAGHRHEKDETRRREGVLPPSTRVVRTGCSGAQLSMKLLSCFERLGWRSLRRAFASIWRMRSRVTSKSWPTSSSV